jgi:hypothetical protein
MKKLFILVLLSSSLFVFAACGTKEITETIVDANSEDVQKSEN